MTGNCASLNADGLPCASPGHLVGTDGLCPTHRNGNAHLRAIAPLGGQANKAKLEGQAFTAADLPAIVTLEDAKVRLNVIADAVMVRRLTHSEGASAAKAVAEWVKADGAAQTQRLVNDLQAALDAKGKEIDVLRKQLASNARKAKGAQ